MEFYESLGLDPKLALGLDDLQKRFYERSRQWHPDRFSLASPQEQQHSLDMTALLNDAFRTLRDPVPRAEYFLKQNGLELSKEAPPELLEEVFELNMALEELREGGDTSAVAQAHSRFQAMRDDIDRELAGLFDQYDRSAEAGLLEGIRSRLSRRRYVSNLLREVEKGLNVHAAN